MAKTAITTAADVVDLVAALKAASPADLAAIDERIAECERELAGLREVRRILDRRLNGSPTRKSPTRSGQSGGSELAKQLYDALSERGKATSQQLGELMGLTAQQVGIQLAKSPWFRRLDSGVWVIAKTQDAT